MFVVLFDYLLVCVWYASGLCALMQVTSTCCPPGYNWECSCCCPGRVHKEGEKDKERASTAWMRDKFVPFLYKLRWVLIILTVALTVRERVLP